MRPITLRLLFPALALGLSTACAIGFVHFQYLSQRDQLVGQRRDEVGAALTRLQQELEQIPRAGRADAVRDALGRMAAMPDYTGLAITDRSGLVLFSNRPDWRGRPLDVVGSDRRPVWRSPGVWPRTDADARGRIDAVAPLRLGDGNRRLYIRYDLDRQLGTLHQRIIQGGWLLWSLMLLLALITLALVQWLVLSPLRRFTEATQHLADGDYSARLGPFPSRELTRLSERFNTATETLRHRFDMLNERQAALELCVDALPDVVAILGEDGACLAIFGNRRLMHPDVARAISRRESIGRQLVPDHMESIFEAITDALATGETGVLRYTSETALGRRRLSARLIPLEQSLQGQRAVLWLSTDVTESERMQRELELMAVAFQTHEGIAITDSKVRVLKSNREFTRITGYAPEHIRGQRLVDLLHDPSDTASLSAMRAGLRASGYWSGEVWHRRRDMTRYPALQIVTAVGDDKQKPDAYVIIFMDITERKEAERLIAWQARYDALTELPNRRHVTERLDEQLALALRHELHGSVLFIDLDHFVQINESLGHGAGDELLCAVVERIQHWLRRENFFARFGADKFVIQLPVINQSVTSATNRAEELAHELLKLFAAPFVLEGRELYISASIGACVFPSQAHNSLDILRRAETAMYVAKRLGRGMVQCFAPGMEIGSQRRLARLGEIHHALENDEFTLFYQPQFDRDGGMIGAEALVRWQHPSRGLLPPGEFIPIAEESGLILRIGEWVLREAARQHLDWHRRGVLPAEFCHSSINVSARQLNQPDFTDQCIAIIRDVGADPAWFELELTESVLADNLAHMRASLIVLREAGFHIAVDDFGTGYCSLNYLKRLPVQTLKIDQTFIRDLGTSESDARIVETILAMARHLKLRVVAEGVETDEQLAFLHDHGCTGAQGYLFSRPVTTEDLEVMFRRSGVASGV